MWRYHLGSGTPKCCLANCTKMFRKMPLWTSPMRYLWGSTRGDLAPLWKAPQTCNRTITSLGPISLVPLLEAFTRSKMYPKPAIYRVNLESGPVTEDDMLPMGHCRDLPPVCPLPCWDGGGWQSTGTAGQVWSLSILYKNITFVTLNPYFCHKNQSWFTKMTLGHIIQFMRHKIEAA